MKTKKIYKKICSLALCVAMAVCASPIATFANTTISHEAEEHILRQIRGANIPSASIAVIQGEHTSFIHENSDDNTLFQIGSLAKSFTGLGVLLLEDMGLLSVHDPVNQHLPWFEVRYNGVPVPHEDITISNLLHHTCGLTSDERRLPPLMAEGVSQDEFITSMIGVELAHYPSTVHAYSSHAYAVLGILIEAVSGQSYHEFMTEQVLHPLGLYNTFTNIEEAHGTGRVIGGNRLGFLSARHWNPYTPQILIPTGLIYSDIVDMARWAKIQMGIADVSEQFARIVQRSHTHHHHSDTPFENVDFIYGAGWRIRSANGTIEHGGQTPGYSAMFRIWADNDTAVIVLSNLMQDNIGQFNDIILNTVVYGYFEDASIDFLRILDIGFSILTAVGLFYVLLFIRLAIKLSKRLKNGEVVKVVFTSKDISKLFDPILGVVGVLAFYVGIPTMFDTSFGHLIMTGPASMTTAGIALWIMLAYSLFAFSSKVFVKDRY